MPPRGVEKVLPAAAALVVDPPPLLLSIHDAAMAGSVAMITQFLDGGVSVHDDDGYGAVPLHYAAVGGQRPALSLLIQRGADVNAVNAADGTTALYICAANGDRAAVQLLLAAGAQAAIATIEGETPRAVALAAGRADIVALL